MDAKLTKIDIRPTKLNGKGEILYVKYASVTLNIPMDNTENEVEVKNLTSVLDSEHVELIIKPFQERLDLGITEKTVTYTPPNGNE